MYTVRTLLLMLVLQYLPEPFVLLIDVLRTYTLFVNRVTVASLAEKGPTVKKILLREKFR